MKLHTTPNEPRSYFQSTLLPEAYSPVYNMPPPSLEGRRVLVVEDSEDNRLLVKLLLARKGMSVDFAENGQIAVERAPRGSYDFVLMDMQMPVKDGYAATRELRDLGFEQPILALTAHAMKDDRARCLAAGCDEYLTKPIDSRALYAALHRHLPVAVEDQQN